MTFVKGLIRFSFTLFLTATLLFIGLRLAPGNPVERILGPNATEEEIIDLKIRLNLDQSLWTQYGRYLKDLSHGELGESLIKKKSVTILIKDNLSPTLILSTVSVFLSFVLGSVFGIFAADRKATIFDHSQRVFSLLGLSVPIFSTAPLLVLLFSIKLGWLPVSEWLSVKHMILPIVTLVLPLSSILSRVARTRYIEEKGELWVNVLRAKGLRENQIKWRILVAILPSILSVVALQLAVVLAGTMVTETIYDINGIGSLLFESIQNRDYPLVQGIILYSTLIYFVVFQAFDFISIYLNPRIANENHS